MPRYYLVEENLFPIRSQSKKNGWFLSSAFYPELHIFSSKPNAILNLEIFNLSDHQPKASPIKTLTPYLHLLAPKASKSCRLLWQNREWNIEILDQNCDAAQVHFDLCYPAHMHWNICLKKLYPNICEKLGSKRLSEVLFFNNIRTLLIYYNDLLIGVTRYLYEASHCKVESIKFFSPTLDKKESLDQICRSKIMHQLEPMHQVVFVDHIDNFIERDRLNA